MDFPILSPALGMTVSIDKSTERLRIVDPRPTADMAVTVVVLVVALVLVFSDFVTDSIWSSVVGGVAFLYFVYRSVTRPFRDVYVIDKEANAYHLHRQSVFKTRTETADTRQISAVQVEHIVTHGDSRSDHYRVVFLMKMELLFGMPPSQPIRESNLLFSHRKTEARIAKAIADYLGVRFDDNVDKATFA